MDEIPIFRSEPLKNYPLEKQLELLGVLAVKLAEAAECNNKKETWEKLNSISQIGHGLGCNAFDILYDAVAMSTTFYNQTNEHYYQSKFKEYADLLIPGCKIIRRKTDGKNIPDAWVDIGGSIGPVEVKYTNFDKKATNQLSRYMNVYNAHFGVAVARKLSVNLPENIIFVSLDKIDELDQKDK